MANRHKKIARDPEINLYVFSNTPKDEAAFQLLQLFYRGSFENSIGISRMKNTDTGVEELVLVGVAKDEEGKPQLFPLAVALNPTTVKPFVSPDGLGGWFEPRSTTEEVVEPVVEE